MQSVLYLKKEKEECTEYKVNFEYFQIYTEYSTVMYVCMYARVTFMHVHEHAIGTDNSYWLYKIWTIRVIYNYISRPCVMSVSILSIDSRERPQRAKYTAYIDFCFASISELYSREIENHRIKSK